MGRLRNWRLNLVRKPGVMSPCFSNEEDSDPVMEQKNYSRMDQRSEGTPVRIQPCSGTRAPYLHADKKSTFAIDVLSGPKKEYRRRKRPLAQQAQRLLLRLSPSVVLLLCRRR